MTGELKNPKPVQDVLSYFNEKTLSKRAKQNELENALSNKYVTIDQYSTDEDHEEDKPFDYIYTSNGQRVNNFKNIPIDTKLLILVDKSNIRKAEQLGDFK